MKYILNKNIALRSFQMVPFAYYVKGKRNACGLKKEEFDLLLQCDGIRDLEETPLLFALCLRGLCEPCEEGGTLTEWQKHRVCDNTYFPAMEWMMTGKCNYNCLHCFNAADNLPLQTEWSYEEAIRLLDQARDCGIHAITLTGGEPFVHSRFFDILKAICERGMFVIEINTNGYFITEEVLDRMLEIGCRPMIKISFDGIGFHDWMRNHAGAEKNTLQAIRLCAEKGFDVMAQIQFNRKNKDVIFETLLRMEELGCTASRLIYTTPTLRWEQNAEGNSFRPEEFFEECLELTKAYISGKHRMRLIIWQFGTILPAKDGYVFRITDETLEYRESRPLCQGARGKLAVSSNGEIYPCLQMSGYMEGRGIHWGNLKKESLKEILKDSPYLCEVCATIGDLLKENEKCAACSYLKLCRGGCRASALLYGGSLRESDPIKCLFFKGGYYDQAKKLFA